MDTGIGMAQEVLERVFEPYIQADNSITRKFGGSGLGLTISRHFAQALGGQLTVRSELGKGSTFTLTIDPGPLEGVAILEPEAVELTESLGQQAPSELRLPKCRVLVVEDGLSNQKLIKVVLERAGAVVQSATNGQEGLQMASTQTFDVILMDMQMPLMDGYTATALLRQRGCKLPIIALTAAAMKGDEEKCRAAGCDGFLSKPLDMDSLLRTVAGAIGSQPPGMLPNFAVPTHTPAHADILKSTLPTDDADFKEIVEMFIDRLHHQLSALEKACTENDLANVASLAHWLKGSAGTAGFDAFTDPARKLEQLAEDGSMAQVQKAVAHLKELASRIEVPANTASIPGSVT
jgi:CheY-like chemotaxis protein